MHNTNPDPMEHSTVSRFCDEYDEMCSHNSSLLPGCTTLASWSLFDFPQAGKFPPDVRPIDSVEVNRPIYQMFLSAQNMLRLADQR